MKFINIRFFMTTKDEEDFSKLVRDEFPQVKFIDSYVGKNREVLVCHLFY